ncbi:RNA-binding cell elongation regulator Jag/EloR [Hespellia stercorisuis]|uniref:RNA-binding protein KhpB n=1 Tax=Hespellia stercorisuis DSM 15480 TaxID=1121950 RepID=A0A1M6R7Q7_9FIRM|nr:RNA-binding cell elongation regulator Jag/EloR [Hespellia stercorisuis]SHK28358.1 spoIIIJ-associated protein [Hespellia stercorisuis DSM 15480]
MGDIRVSAKTVDDAITEASIQLGIPSSELEYDIIEKGSAGFLGIGMKQAVIDVRKKVVKPEVQEVVKETAKETIKEEKKEQIKTESKTEDSRTDAKPKQESKSFKSEKNNSYKKTDNNKFKSDRPAFEKKDRQEVKADSEDGSKTEVTSQKKDVELAKVSEETKKATVDFIQNTLKAMSMEVELTCEIDGEGALCIDMKGDNMGILIGKRGQTLDSLQYLANRVANKNQEGYVRVKLDTEDYRKRRKATLENLAKNIAYKVKRTKKPVSLEPMNPYERRIIHAALQSDRYVTTHSEGEEPYRKIVVTLKK